MGNVASRMLDNMWTTAVGAVLAVAYYLKTNGATVPSTKQEWLNLAVAALLGALGLASKDATTGSKPGAKS